MMLNLQLMYAALNALIVVDMPDSWNGSKPIRQIIPDWPKLVRQC